VGELERHGYDNPAYDKLYQRQLVTVNQTARAVIGKRMQAIVNADKPCIILVNERWVAAAHTGWTGVDPNLAAEAKTYFTAVRRS
jgi:ABC-type transport system substrate-binding protein